MPDRPDSRMSLARRQAELVRALSGGRTPDGFDADHVAITARSIVSKRADSVQKNWPNLCLAIGERFTELFSQFASTSPAANPSDDGFHFAQWLRSRGLFPDEARLEFACHRTATGFPARILALRSPRRVILVYRLFETFYARSLRWGY